MAGTLNVDTVKSSTSDPPTFANAAGTEIGQLCRAWVNFNGASGAIRGSFGVSSVTRFAAGSYTVNFTNAMPSQNYAVAGNHSLTDAYRGGHIICADFSGSSTYTGTPEGSVKLTTSCRIYTIVSVASVAPVDAASVSVGFFGG